jgi:hypothetical protein
MHIYIDESGIFNNLASKRNVASCVAALAIPSSKKVKLFEEFKTLTSGWSGPSGEVKGKELDEAQIAAVVAMLQKYDVVLEITAMDLGIHTQTEISSFKQRQADEVIKYITPEHNAEVVKQLHEIRDIFNKMSNQLFVQAFIMFLLIPRTLRHIITYYARRIPKELKSFHWVIDAKAPNITDYERAWSLAIFPVMYAQSLKEPMVYVEGGDYSYFERFQDTDKESIERIATSEGFQKGEIGATKLELILGKNFKFQDSKDNVGLQMADILANATQRALNGRLQRAGWGEIGSLMILQNPEPLQTIKFNNEDRKVKSVMVTTPFYGVIKTYKSKAKPMWLDRPLDDLLIRKNRKKNRHRMRPRDKDIQ